MDILRLTFVRTIPKICKLSSLSAKNVSFCPNHRILGRCSIHTTSVKQDLNEFFDKDNYDVTKVETGRPWRKDELRLKSSQDLHKLWYILLKERNMLLTMEHMYEDALDPYINPERVFKVEESMENLMEVVKERNIAYELLEKGKTDELPTTKVIRNVIGLPMVRREKEHVVPKHENNHYKRLYPSKQGWMDKYLVLYEEKLRKDHHKEERKNRKLKKALSEKFDLEEEDLPEFEDKNKKKLQKHLDMLAELNDHSG